MKKYIVRYATEHSIEVDADTPENAIRIAETKPDDDWTSEDTPFDADRCADEAIQAGYDGWDALDGDLRRALVKWYVA